MRKFKQEHRVRQKAKGAGKEYDPEEERKIQKQRREVPLNTENMYSAAGS